MNYTKNENYINSVQRQINYKKEDLKEQTENLISLMNEAATRLEKYINSEPWELKRQIENAVHDIQWQNKMIEKTYEILKEDSLILDAINQAFIDDTADMMEQNEFTL